MHLEPQVVHVISALSTKMRCVPPGNAFNQAGLLVPLGSRDLELLYTYKVNAFLTIACAYGKGMSKKWKGATNPEEDMVRMLSKHGNNSSFASVCLSLMPILTTLRS